MNEAGELADWITKPCQQQSRSGARLQRRGIFLHSLWPWLCGRFRSYGGAGGGEGRAFLLRPPRPYTQSGPSLQDLTRLLSPPTPAGLRQPCTRQPSRAANSQGTPNTPMWGVASGDFPLPLPTVVGPIFRGFWKSQGRRKPPCELSSFRPQVRRGHLTTGASPPQRTPRPRASPDRHGNRPLPRVTPARRAPLGCRQQVSPPPRAARGLQPWPGLAAPRPARLRPAALT